MPSGSTIDAGGTANTKGSYTQMVASTSRDYCALAWCMDSLNVTPANTANFLVDVAIGGAGSEQVIVSNLFAQHVAGTQTFGATLYGVYK